MQRFIVFLDVETTGVNPYADDIIQLSAIRFFGNKELDRLNTYIDPERPIPPESTSINGITDEMVKDAPKIADVKEAFLEFIEDSILVGYNTTFDLRFISVAFGGILDGTRYLDALHLAKSHLDLPDYRLETVAKHLGFSPKDRFHDSLTDCEATADVFWKLSALELSFYSPVFRAPKRKKKALEHFRVKEIVPQATPSNVDHPLYGKQIVFTGELSITRRYAAQMAADAGAIIKNSISSKTNFLVVGAQDPMIVEPDGMSGKEAKAHELNAIGKASIEIITENEFMTLLKGGAQCG